MKANELRIGNWVMDKVPFKINIGDFSEEVESGWISKSVQPIPLTPEILEMVGFKKEPVLGNSAKYWYHLGELSYNESHQKWWFRGILSIEIKHLHQLQNLYFALTGEELDIKL